YNNVDLDTQLRFGNVSETNATATVHLYIGGQEMISGCSPSNSPYTLPAGASLRVSCPGTNNGPVRIVSDIPIVAAERVIYKVNNLPTSFSEMMALPNSQLNTAYWLPWYNNVDQIGRAHVCTPVTPRSTLFPYTTLFRSIYKVNNLPTSFSEMMALPNSQLNTAYWLPWYNNVD